MSRKIFHTVICLFLAAVLLNGCQENDQIADISHALGVDVSQGTVLDSRDSHGGFHGDGLLAVTISFTQEQADMLLEQFPVLAQWREFPLSANLNAALYGESAPGYTRIALIRDYDTDALLVPEIKNGWYYFYDRFSEAEDPLDASALFSRGSYNFTLAVFDTDTLTLYYFEFDT